MFNVSNLYSITRNNVSPGNFWWIDKKLLTVEHRSFESLAMSEPVVQKLLSALSDVTKDLLNKSDYVFSKTKDIFNYRMRLEQASRIAKNSKIAWTSLQSVEVLGFSFESCKNQIESMRSMGTHIATSIQRTPIQIVDETPNLSDDDIVSSINDLSITVNAGKVKFFNGTTKNAVMSAVDDMISFDKSTEAMCGYSQNIISDTKTLDVPIKKLAAHETVEINNIHLAVDEVNNRITTINHLLNAMFLLQSYNKVLNVVFTDAISNLKEG